MPKMRFVCSPSAVEGSTAGLTSVFEADGSSGSVTSAGATAERGELAVCGNAEGVQLTAEMAMSTPGKKRTKILHDLW